MNTGFQNIQSAIAGLTNELRGSTKTQWPVIWSAIGVSFAILIAVGSQALSPIRENVASVKDEVAGLKDAIVPRQELDWRSARSAEDRQRMEGSIMDLRAGTVTRNEWSERNRARDQEIADMGRRVEELRQQLGSQYTTRDVLLELQSEVKDLRAREARARP